MLDEKCCGTCKHHRCEKSVGWYCDNKESEFYTIETDYKDTCDEYESK